MSLKDDLMEKGWLLEFPTDLRKERVNIRTLAFTINASADLIDRLETLRKKHDMRFDAQAGAVSEDEAKEMFCLAQNLDETVRAWLRSNHPELCTEFT